MHIDFLSLYIPYTFDMHLITIFVLWAHDYEMYEHCILFAKYALMTLYLHSSKRLCVVFSVTPRADCDFKTG